MSTPPGELQAGDVLTDYEAPGPGPGDNWNFEASAQCGQRFALTLYELWNKTVEITFHEPCQYKLHVPTGSAIPNAVSRLSRMQDPDRSYLHHLIQRQESIALSNVFPWHRDSICIKEKPQPDSGTQVVETVYIDGIRYLKQVTPKPFARTDPTNASFLIVTLMTMLLVALVAARTASLRRYGAKYVWLSARGISDVCILLGTGLMVAYAVIQSVYAGGVDASQCVSKDDAFFESQNWRREKMGIEPLEFYTVEALGSWERLLNQTSMAQSGYSGNWARTEIMYQKIMLRIAARYVLAVALWIMKFGFVSVFFEFHHTLKRWHKRFLYAITATQSVMFVIVVVYTVVKNVQMLKIDAKMSEDTYYLGYSDAEDGLPFVLPTSEYLLSAFDITTDALLVAFFIILVRSLKLSGSELRRLLILILPAVITISMATGRLMVIQGSILGYPAKGYYLRLKVDVYKMMLADLDKYGHRRTFETFWQEIQENQKVAEKREILLSILAPVGTYTAGYVVCLPGLRVLMRRWREGAPCYRRMDMPEDGSVEVIYDEGASFLGERRRGGKRVVRIDAYEAKLFALMREKREEELSNGSAETLRNGDYL